MRVGELIAGIKYVQLGAAADQVVTGLAYDSRDVRPGCMFVALKGEHADGHRFIPEALRRGAVLVVVSDEEALTDVPNFLLVEDTRAALSALAHALYGAPSSKLNLVGVTGTNGKTTYTYIAEAALSAAGRKVGVIGTVDYRYSGKSFTMPHTTPEAPVFCRFLDDMVSSEVDVALAEVSSHAIEMKRADDLQFAVAVFTNLSRDHLDFHGTLEEYGAVKARLFTELGPRGGRLVAAVINVDDPVGAEIASGLDYPVLTYGLAPEGADATAAKVEATYDGLAFTACGPWGELEIRSALVGRHNVYNILAALATAHVLGADVAQAAAGIEGLATVPGRLESIDNPGDLGLWVDYCHTPDALSQVLQALRPLVSNRLITVFGAGGDRDREKRALMAEAVEAHSDLAVVTSDNPRSEAPLAIIDDILQGLSPEYRLTSTVVIPDRATAIEAAISMGREGDGVLIGGKGHESYQLVGDEVLHFDDRETARAVVAKLGGRSA